MTRLALLLVLAPVVAAHAQRVGPVAVGDRVRITSPALPAPLYGQVTGGVGADTITVATAGDAARVTLPIAAIQRIDVSRGRHAARGAAAGVGIGAGIGLVAGGVAVGVAANAFGGDGGDDGLAIVGGPSRAPALARCSARCSASPTPRNGGAPCATRSPPARPRR